VREQGCVHRTQGGHLLPPQAPTTSCTSSNITPHDYIPKNRHQLNTSPPPPRAGEPTHLQHDGQLLWWFLVCVAVCQPQLKGRKLLTEEAAWCELSIGVRQQLGQLQQTHLCGQVPGVPHGVLVCGWQAGVAHWAAGTGGHDALSKEEVAEQGGDQQVLREGEGHTAQHTRGGGEWWSGRGDVSPSRHV